MRNSPLRLCKWTTSILVIGVGCFFVYSHLYLLEPEIALRGETQTRRFLNSIDQVEVTSDSLPIEEANDKIKFVEVNTKGLESVREKEQVSIKEKERTPTISPKRIKEKKIIEQKGLLSKVKFQNEKKENLPKKKAMTTLLQKHPSNVYYGNAAAAWNGGTFRYNSFGHPVYNHHNRANYVPEERVIHLDLKGAPLLPSAYNVLITWLAKYGATAILMEYEDMFPWEGNLASLAAKNHYTKEDIKKFLDLCKENNLKVIPLVQTFGHLEFALKLEPFSYLREVPELPQALCPSQADSQLLVRSMIDQIMKLHPDSNYLHIGCDEVFQIGECAKCRVKSRDKLFLDHVSKTANYVRETYDITPIIWHDMLSHVSESVMKEYNFGELVEPMIWVYAEDVYRFVQPYTWTKFSKIFPYVWGASAFKGAFGEQSTVPNVRRHLDNNLNWLDVIASEMSKFSGGIRGLVLTGWQRHDHFAVLCELIPSALPSLAVSLISTSHGHFNSSIYPEIYEAMKCRQTPKYLTNLNLENDPYLWDRFSYCSFPGSSVFKLTAHLDSVKNDIRSFIDKLILKRAWITPYNRRHNFSSPMRIDQDLEGFQSKLYEVNHLIKLAKEALSEWYDEWTVGEWIEQHIWPLLSQLQNLKKEAESMKLVKFWPARPLPLLKELEVYGIKAPMDFVEETKTHQRFEGEFIKEKAG